jgi:signal transduction histidine kinase
VKNFVLFFSFILFTFVCNGESVVPDNDLLDSLIVYKSSGFVDYISRIVVDKDNFDIAYCQIQRGISRGKELGNDTFVCLMNYYLADLFYYNENYNKALIYYEQILPDFRKARDTLMISKIYNNIGLCYFYLDDDNNSLKFYLNDINLLDSITQRTKDLSVQKIIVLTNVINLYRSTWQYDKVIEFGLMASESAKEIGDTVRLASIFNSMGMAYKNLKKIDKAIEAFHQAEELFTQLGDDYRKAFVYVNYGGIYDFINIEDSSLLYFNRALNIFIKEKYIYGQLQAYTGIAEVFIKQKKEFEARNILLNSIDTAHVYGFKELVIDAYFDLAKLEYQLGDYRKAYDYKEKYYALYDSLNAIEMDKQYAELQTRYETVQKESEINLLKSEKLIQDNKLRKSELIKWTGVSIIVILLVIFYVGAIFYRQKRNANIQLTEKNRQIEVKNEQLAAMNLNITQMNEQLQESQVELTNANNAKDRFFSILAHDLRNPFHNIMGESYLLSKSYDRLSPDERKRYASDIFSSCEQVDRLLGNLLEWSRTQSKGITFQPMLFDFQLLVQNSLSVLKSSSDEKSISVENRIVRPIQIYADYTMLETVVRNMIHNSIKFTPYGGNITLSASIDNEKLVTSISDTGVGIDEENLGKLFQIDSNIKTRGTGNENGTGLGLVICKEFINYHKGEIWAESSPGKGSVFYFSIPIA